LAYRPGFKTARRKARALMHPVRPLIYVCPGGYSGRDKPFCPCMTEGVQEVMNFTPRPMYGLNINDHPENFVTPGSFDEAILDLADEMDKKWAACLKSMADLTA